jgi:hypothetical protein
MAESFSAKGDERFRRAPRSDRRQSVDKRAGLADVSMPVPAYIGMSYPDLHGELQGFHQ